VRGWIIRKTCILDVGVLAAPRGRDRLFQHPIRLSKVEAINEEKSRMVDLSKGETFSFLGFEFRRILSRNQKWRPYFAPKLRNGQRCLQSSGRSSDRLPANP
jgi:hypothetical protein